MAVLGFSSIYLAKYAHTGTQVTYTDGVAMEEAVSIDVSIETSEIKKRADNVDKYSIKRFQSGELSTTVAELYDKCRQLITNAETNTVTIDEEEVTEEIYSADTDPNHLGFGGVIKKLFPDGSTRYRAIIFPKVKFSFPNDAAETEEEEPNLQDTELTGSILRDDTEKQVWKREATFETEAHAVAYIKKALSIDTE